MKKIFIVFSFLFPFLSLFLCCGCQSSSNTFSNYSKNSIQMGLETTQNGIIIQRFSFPILTEERNEKYIKELTYSIEQNIYNNLFLSYWVKYLQNPVEKYKIGGEYVKFVKPEYDSENNNISFYFIFGGQTAWNVYNSENAGKSDNKESSVEGLVSTVKSQSIFPFAIKSSDENYIGGRYKKIIKTVFFKYFSDKNMPEINYIYEYTIPSGRIHSNANYQFVEEGLYHHVWIVKESELDNCENMEIWQNQVNPGWWYLLVLCIGVPTTGIAIWICSVKKRKK